MQVSETLEETVGDMPPVAGERHRHRRGSGNL